MATGENRDLIGLEVQPAAAAHTPCPTLRHVDRGDPIDHQLMLGVGNLLWFVVSHVCSFVPTCHCDELRSGGGTLRSHGA